MKILFLLKYYEPFDRGGSEWSTHDLARLLVKKGDNVTILTPNYGAISTQDVNGIKIVRFPFIKKLKDPKSPVAPFWTNNILFFIYSSLYVAYFVSKFNFDIVHIHNSEFIPAGVIAGKINKKKTVVTLRDYQTLCNLGFCLWDSDVSCKSLDQYLSKDFNFFYKNYVTQKSTLKRIFLQAAAIRGWIMQKIIYFFSKQVDTRVAVSNKTAQIYKINGIKNIHVINNPILVSQSSPKSDSKTIIYVGKLSPGKGVDILLNAFQKAQKNILGYKLLIIGSGILKDKLQKKVKDANLQKKVFFKGQVKHSQVISLLKKTSFTVVPSVWPEPLPRTAIESILSQVPVIVSNRGGTKEVIKNEYGIVCSPTVVSLKDALLKMSKDKYQYKKNIKRDLKNLKEHFSITPSKQYKKIYQYQR